MAKEIIVKAPTEFNFSSKNIEKIHDSLAQNSQYNEMMNYFTKYQDVDSKGRYLYWDEFRWRVEKDDNPQMAWWSTKMMRLFKLKEIELYDKEEHHFNFCIPDSLQAKLYKIVNISRQGIVPHNSLKQNFLISSLIMEEAISSSQLEGASVTRRIAKDMLSHAKKPKSEDEQMILNNYLLMKELKIVKNEELNIPMILSFHKIATQNTTENGVVPGEFRANNEIFISSGRDGEIVHQPPCYTKLPERLAKLCIFANDKHDGEHGSVFIDPIVKAIILHFMIGYEHPFSDGNGRTARAIFYWYMLKNGFDYFEYISISKFLKEAPKKYGMSYLYSEIDDNDLTYFIYYQVEVILRAVDELLSYLQAKSREFEEIATLLQGSKIGERLNFVQKDIVKKALKTPGRIFTAKEISVDYDVSANSARKYLNSLSKEKILISSKIGKSVVYIAHSDIKMVLLDS
ncbi:MAG TPA: Fic family protein [Campylobacterales bacterium]|nr:Fic family protein [Campylobacterales bacterium]